MVKTLDILDCSGARVGEYAVPEALASVIENNKGKGNIMSDWAKFQEKPLQAALPMQFLKRLICANCLRTQP